MSRCVTSSSAKAASTNARRGLLVVLGEVASIGLHSPIAVTIVPVRRRKRALFSAESADDYLVKDRGGSPSRDRDKGVA